MTELLFLLTLVFLGYVAREVFKTVAEIQSGQASPGNPIPAAREEKTVIAVTEKIEAPVAEPAPVVQAVAEPESTDATTEPASAVEPAAAPAPAAPAKAGLPERGPNLRNPATGETAAFPTNYRFAKKWLKEALVEEGLLDHIYKPSELDGAGAVVVKEALEKFRHLDKYHA
ncbi:hypothetical protein SAMN02949497_1040 [Methylomagnum ishizawai]|uniref:Uncharacterized protein n=1 Tax=Methylomagnum ishizawai TaxID=1760988 RepID=A0A1Y6CTJ9_9GAMM|nr:hypothetical protein [Methylomagnum ishizawai]SMF93751.1 hypothetical protein SAMN02949497_1040 [Methylomagnum ishizawai]